MSRKPVYWEDLPYPAKRQVVDVVVRKSYVGPVLIGVGVVGAGVLVYWLLTRHPGKGKGDGAQTSTGTAKRPVLEIYSDKQVLDGQAIRMVDLIKKCQTWTEVEVKVQGDVLAPRADNVLTPLMLANKGLKLVGQEGYRPSTEFDLEAGQYICPDGYALKPGGSRTDPKPARCIRPIIYN